MTADPVDFDALLAELDDNPTSPFATLGPWVQQAACRDADPVDFDAPSEGTGRDVQIGRQLRAARLCASCPVRTECLDDAVANGNTGTVRGGVLITLTGGAYDLVDAFVDGSIYHQSAGRGSLAIPPVDLAARTAA